MKIAAGIFWTLVAMVVLLTLAITAALNAPDPNACPEHLICYEPYGAPVEAQHILNGSIVQVTFVADDDERLQGNEAVAAWVVDYESNLSWCAITAQMPEQVLGDPRMDALGHELLHCIAGNFHP